MRKIVVAFTAAALALSMLAQALPAAAAVTGYDSAYAGESAFVNLVPGQSNEFQVFFANTGTTTWTVGTTTQVDLLACLEDKLSCDQQDATEATWNPGTWLSATRYATSTQASVAPGSIATFKYTVTAPAGVATGTYNFNGDLGLHSTGAKLHPEGYYQAATVGQGAGAATITSLTPSSGPAGTAVTVAGTGFICTPAFPAVSFDTAAGTVVSCGATSVTATAPAHALGAATVTVTNSGGTASNGLTFTYTDTTKPTFTSIAVARDVLTVTFDEPVCGTYDPAQWIVQNVSAGPTDYADASSTSNLPADCTKAVSSFQIFLSATMPTGAFVEATLLANSGNTNTTVTDPSLNPANAPISRQATATAGDTTAPTMVSASGAVATSTITVTFSEPVFCPTGGQPAPGDWTIDRASSTADPTVTAVTGCGTSRSTAKTTLTLTTSIPIVASATYTVTLTAAGANEIQDTSLNSLATPASVTFTGGAADFTPPTMIDARMANNAGPSTDFVEAGDSFTVTFSEKMNGVTTGTISIQDQDGTTATIQCSAVAGANQATCVWDTAVTTLTVTLTGTLANASGTTPGMQIPFNITALTQITDLQGNPPNVLGSPDRLVDYE